MALLLLHITSDKNISAMRVLIVDDHLLFAEGLQQLLQISNLNLELVQPCIYADTLIQRLEEQPIDMILLDINLGSLSGIDLLLDIKSNFPKTKVLMVSMYSSHKLVKQAFMNGADGYILKSAGLNELETAIQEVAGGNVFYGNGVKTTAYNQLENNHITRFSNTFELENVLTRRELEVLHLLMQAKTSREIAEMLFISIQTVGVHRKKIMKKLAVSNAAGLIQKVNEIANT